MGHALVAVKGSISKLNTIAVTIQMACVVVEDMLLTAMKVDYNLFQRES